jgi:O-antigen/teichoic acid export membrane protein
MRVFGRSYQAMGWAYVLAFGGVGSVLLLKAGILKRTGWLGKEKFSSLVKYGAYSFGSGIGSFLILNVQGLIMNSILSPGEVGKYAAYYTATIGIAAYLGYMIGTVLFPKASASSNRRRLWNMTVSGWTGLAPAAVLLFIASQAAVLTLMGRHQYGMQPGMMLLFALCGAVMMAYSSLAQIVFSEGIRAARLSLLMALGGGAINLTACLILIPIFKVSGAAISFLLTYVFLTLWLWAAKGSYL